MMRPVAALFAAQMLQYLGDDTGSFFSAIGSHSILDCNKPPALYS